MTATNYLTLEVAAASSKAAATILRHLGDQLAQGPLRPHQVQAFRRQLELAEAHATTVARCLRPIDARSTNGHAAT